MDSQCALYEIVQFMKSGAVDSQTSLTTRSIQVDASEHV